LALILALAASAPAARAQAPDPVVYRVSFPEPQHRYAQVEAVFAGVGAAPLEIRMSRTSPGRYALHEFARHVFDVHAVDGRGRTLAIERPDPHQWTVSGHDGMVRFGYRVYGDTVDGTFLAVDTTHAHMNMPATLVWARRLEGAPCGLPSTPGRHRLADRHAAAADGRSADLHRGEPAAPDGQPHEFSDFTLRTLTVSLPEGRAVPAARREATIRLALHHDGGEREADALMADIARVAREAGAVFGEFPDYDEGQFTFVADYLPYASGDGMEHRNSAVVTSSAALGDGVQRASLLGTIAHEFFHGWNTERIRPGSLEPFEFVDAKMSGELWIVEGVTSYYESLLMHRAGFASRRTPRPSSGAPSMPSSGVRRRFRSAVVEMSRLAPFVDAVRGSHQLGELHFLITWGAASVWRSILVARAQRRADHAGRLHAPHGGGMGARHLSWKARSRSPRPRRAIAWRTCRATAFADAFFDRFVEGATGRLRGFVAGRAGLCCAAGARAGLAGDAAFGAGRRGVRLSGPAPVGSPVHRAGLIKTMRSSAPTES
jgi:hypothetical protein